MNNTKRIIALAVVLVGSIAVARQDDWTPTTTKDGTMTLSVPPGWIVADDRDPKFLEARENILKRNPSLGGVVKGAQNDQIIMLYDMNDPVDDGLLNSLNVVKKNIPGISPAAYDAIKKQLQETMKFKGKPEFKTIDLPVGKTLRYSGTMEIVQSETAKVTMDVMGYMFCKGDSFYVVTFSASEGQMKAKRELYEKIVKTAKLV